jgi:uncharacterized protein GlcG (DUF336 family)
MAGLMPAIRGFISCYRQTCGSFNVAARKAPTMALTLDAANRIITGAIAKATELNIRISVAVCDAGGRLVASQRMDNAIWASAYGSQGKAIASAAFGRPSGELSERASHPTPAGIAVAEAGPGVTGPCWRPAAAVRRWPARAGAAHGSAAA